MKNKIIFLAFFFIFNSTFAGGLSSEAQKGDFFSSIYDDFNFTDLIAEKLSLELGISTDSIISTYNGNDESEFFVEFKYFCAETFPENLSYCKSFLIKKYNSEKENENLLFEIKTYGNSNEVWADGDLDNGFFDIIADLNEIDLILFGENASKFSRNEINSINLEDLLGGDKKGNSSNNSGNKNNKKNPKNIKKNEKILNNIPNKNTQNSGKNEDISNKNYPKNDKNIENNLENNLENNIEKNDDFGQKNEEKNIENNLENNLENIDEICIDPLFFKKKEDLYSKKNNNNFGDKKDENGGKNMEKNINKEKEEKKELFKKTIKNSKNFGKINPDLADKIFSGNIDILENSSKSKYSFSDKNKTDLSEDCKKPAYGGLICLDGKGCEDGEIFCVEVNSKSSLISEFDSNSELFSGKIDIEIGENSCINCLVEFMIKTIKDTLLGRTLVPRENSNKNPSAPNWMGPFKMPNQLISISTKSMNLDKEINDFLEFEDSKINAPVFVESPTNCVDRSIKAGGEIGLTSDNLGECADFQKYLFYKKAEAEAVKQTIKSKDFLQKDMGGRFEEFTNLFQAGVLDNVKGFPFSKVIKIKSCEEKGK